MAKQRDVLAGVALAGFSALVYAMTGGLPEGDPGGGLGPASFPRALAILIGLLSVLLVAQGIASGSVEDDKPLFGPFFARALLFFVALVVYILVIPKIGYSVSTVLFLFSAFLLLVPEPTPRKVVTGLVFSLVATLAVFYVFKIFLGVPLIEGPVDEFLQYNVFRFGG